MKHYLVIDDLGERAQDLRTAAGSINARGPVLDLRIVHRVADVVEASHDKARELARYDAFFIDFELATGRSVAPGAQFGLTIGTERMQVPVTTGLGVMLFLRDVVFKSKTYQEERDKLTADRPRNQRPARMYAFVNIAERRSQLYIGAAGAWFGAPYFKATTVGHLQTWLNDLDKWADTSYYKLAQRQASGFDAVLPALEGAQHWGPFTEAYDFLRVFSKTHGSQAVMAAFRKAAHDELGLTVTWDRANTTFEARINDLQDALHTYLDPFAEMTAWADYKASEPTQPLVKFLNETAVFWQEPDVRYALLAHRGAPGSGTSEHPPAAAESR